MVTEALRRLIIRKGSGSELKQRAIMDGMVTLRQDGWRRVAQGITTVEEVVRVTQTDEVMAETDAIAGAAADYAVTPQCAVLGAQVGNRLSIIRRAKNRCAGDEHVRAILD